MPDTHVNAIKHTSQVTSNGCPHYTHVTKGTNQYVTTREKFVFIDVAMDVSSDCRAFHYTCPPPRKDVLCGIQSQIVSMTT
jgi:hypothetical protein